MTYFSERELGERPRRQEEITAVVWTGLQTEITARVLDGSFGARYPEACPDGAGSVGTNELAFWNAMRARIPSLKERPWEPGSDQPSSVHDVMDIVEFCWRSIGKPIKRGYHSFFMHDHLNFDIEEGQLDFEEVINEIFRMNGLAFKINNDGKIQRLVPPVLDDAVSSILFATGDALLDGMLEDARWKFLNPDEDVRREALEKLWDAFERVKTLEPGAHKAAQAKALLDKAAKAGSPKFREVLELEASALTTIGNNFHIRHSETNQVPLSSSHQVDYLFHRLFAFLSLVLRATQRM